MLTELQKRKRREYVAVRRLDPSYKAQEAAKNKLWRQSPEVQKQKVINQVSYERRKKFGLTEDDLMTLRLIQGGHCLICDTDSPGGRGDWHVDHDHETGAIRGLLCSACNRGLGMFKDNPQFLRNAALYIEYHKEHKE